MSPEKISQPNKMKKLPIIILCAPSGAGKTTIAKALLKNYDDYRFSISATTRPKRPAETEGRDYHFLSKEDFFKKAEKGEFLEWEEVYPGVYYGTLKEEIKRIEDLGKRVIFDVDVKGALRLKEIFGGAARSIFIAPPTLAVLAERLRRRATESEDKILERLAKAQEEMSYADKFDKIIINDDLERAISECRDCIEANDA